MYFMKVLYAEHLKSKKGFEKVKKRMEEKQHEKE